MQAAAQLLSIDHTEVSCMPNMRRFIVLPALPDKLKELEVLARNMFWCWNLDLVRLFKRIDSNLWKGCGYNPVRLLAGVSQERLNELAGNESFLSELGRCSEKLKNYIQSQAWYQREIDTESSDIIAYFSAEFGLHECIPIYSGGLGILAGDHLKTASDLGIPMVGVGLLYQKGYFRQYLNIDGWQQEAYVACDFYNMPVEHIRDEEGNEKIISVEYPDGPVSARIWSIDVGRVKLYLLDTNIDDNTPQGRQITSSLYGGDSETRIKQEIMLGIGGLRALKAVGIKPTVCHMNEGHAAFLGLERIRELMAGQDMTFHEALEATRAGNVFTVHTPVKAGNDEFTPEMTEKYLGSKCSALGVSKEQLLALGRVNPQDTDETFKMPVLAIRLSSYRNGVSELHGEVSRQIWSPLWPQVPTEEIPIDSITNGVHIKSWLSEEMNVLFERYLGPDWPEESVDSDVWKYIDSIPDEELWRPHLRSKVSLVAFARNRLKAQMQRRGTYHAELNWAEEVLDPEALTIGFARRFATYKRGNLLLKDPKRLIKILTNPEMSVQVVFAGKAHPRDTEGKEIIRQIIHFANQYNVRRRIVFLEDYEMNVARYMVRGVDIWLNNPRRPMEASGTSGMKAALNGALNLSTLDGWWCEGYKPDGGWVIGGGESYEDAAYQDSVESQAIYNMLENEIVPLYYTRSADQLPRAWIQRMKNSMKWNIPRFNTFRMFRDYMSNSYGPAAKRWKLLTENNNSRAKALSSWNARLRSAWGGLNILDVDVRLHGQNGDGELYANQRELKVGTRLDVKALVKLGKVNPADISVQLYNGPVNSWGNISRGTTITMQCDDQQQNNADNQRWFSAVVPCERSGNMGLAVRIVPRHQDLANPWEPGLVLWEGQTSK